MGAKKLKPKAKPKRRKKVSYEQYELEANEMSKRDTLSPIDREIRDQWLLAEAALKTKEPVLLLGPPGIGKTYAAVKYSRSIQRRLYVQNVTLELLAAQMMGHPIQSRHGGFVWMDGPSIAACREGCPLLLNEIDHGGADCQSFMHFLADGKDVATVTLPNEDKEQVSIHPDYQLIATMNGNISDMPYALMSRFTIKIHLDGPNPEAIALLPKRLRRLAMGKRTETSIDLRALFAFARLTETLNIPDKDASIMIFQKRAAEVLDAIKLAA
jgi:MoxR-like ATPase